MKKHKINWWMIATIVLLLLLVRIVIAEVEETEVQLIDGIVITQGELNSIAQMLIRNNLTDVGFWNPSTNESIMWQLY